MKMKHIIAMIALLAMPACRLIYAGDNKPLASFNNPDRILEIGLQAVLKKHPDTTATQWEFDVITHTLGSKQHFRLQLRPDFQQEYISVSFRRFLKKYPVDKYGQQRVDRQFCFITLTPEGKVYGVMEHNRALFNQEKPTVRPGVAR
jgi:hypothetical protein